MTNIKNENYNVKQYLQEIIQRPLDIFHELTAWSEEDRQTFSILLETLKKPFDRTVETTKDKGDRLENLVSFIIRKSYFFEIHQNIRTGTNEIDEVITLSSAGRQALHLFAISRDILEIDTDIALGECKNYASTLGVTYVGKFYSLLVSTDVSFGIIFTQKGLTGNEDEFRDANGLTKVLRIIEKYQNNKELFILTFTLEDYEKIAGGESFYDLVKAKKIAFRLSSEYDSFLKDFQHDNSDSIKQIIQNI
ncbi:hypothetical protein NXH76_14030 [Blautia schinkii]|nr:hypothetical protein [Blautia schinkii]